MTGGTIATIGHGSASFGVVRGVLVASGIDTIIDIRSRPYSRYAPDFNRGSIDDLTAAAGIGYRWLGEHLGGRPSDPSLLDDGGDLDVERVMASPGFQAGILTVVGLAAGGGVTLLCSEEDPNHCHRSTLVAPVLQEQGARVVHLRHDGTVQPHQPSLGI